MARWLRHNIADADGILALSHAVYRQRQPLPAAIGFDEAGPMAGLGLGWVKVAEESIHPTVLAKSGGGEIEGQTSTEFRYGLTKTVC